MRYAKIKGMTMGFDGLVVECGRYISRADYTLVEVKCLTKPNMIIGDREISYPLPDFALWVNVNLLEECDFNERREFASTNPWGNVDYEGRHVIGDIEVITCKFEKCLQVTVMNNKKTIYAQNFFMFFDEIRMMLNKIFSGEVDDLIFDLQRIKQKENKEFTDE
jgi:hypothetical protein